MGKMLDKFKGNARKVDNYVEDRVNRPKDFQNKRFNLSNSQEIGNIANIPEERKGNFNDYDDFNDRMDYPYFNSGFDEVGVQPAQKPESFHHFILENQYKDLERSIRGLKDIWNKHEQKWITKRKERHCFTDEEAEDILRLAQSHLATDIKLGRINKDVFGAYMDAIYKEIALLFESIAEYRYGRYGDIETQYEMKLQNQKIFLELWTRIQANYSRSIGGQENIDTHGSVKGQESLQSTSKDISGYEGGYS